MDFNRATIECLEFVRGIIERYGPRPAGTKACHESATEIGDRRQAITATINELKAGDVLLIAGKGHETGQIVGSRVLEFSDHDAVAAALKEKVA